mgnify:CR=1 FL=1
MCDPCFWILGSCVGGVPLVNRLAEGMAMGRSGFIGVLIDPELSLYVPSRIEGVTVDCDSDPLPIGDNVRPDNVM